MTRSGKPRVVIYCRFSTDEQRQQSIKAQRLFCERSLASIGITAESVRFISDEALSGELKHRPGIDEVRQLIESEQCDLVISEESSRLYRDVGYCLELFGCAADLKIRIICPNDEVDTSRKDWRKRLIEAQQHHTQANECTRNRLLRTIEELWNSGAAIGPKRSGYRRIERDTRARRSTKVDEIDPVWLPVIQSAYQKVADGESLTKVAGFLTVKGLPKCSNSRSVEWSDSNVIALIRRSVHRGVERYREFVSEKQYTTGIMKSVPNPNPNMVWTRNMPHLRMVDDLLWYSANNVIDGRARKSESLAGRNHPLYGIPRDSRSPLSNLFVCRICGGKMYMTGRNEGGYRCSAATHGECWNKTTALRELTHQRIGSAVSQAIIDASQDSIPELVNYMTERLAERGDVVTRQEEYQRRHRELERQKERLLKVIIDQDNPPEFLTEKVESLKAELTQLERDRLLLEEQCAAHVAIPSREELGRHLNDVANNLTLDDSDSGSLLRNLIDGPIRAIPCQQFGSRKIVLRCEFTLQLVQLLPGNVRMHLQSRESPSTENLTLLRRPIVLDLFEASLAPKHAMDALTIYQSDPAHHPTLVELAEMLHTAKHTAHVALQLGRKMQAAGLTDPYIPLSKCPENPARWKFKKAS